MIRDTRPGRRSSGNFSKNLRFNHFGRITGLFDIIVEITNGKCLFSFEVAAPIQITKKTSLAATIMSTVVNKNVTVSVAYTSPRAARKITLSRKLITASSPRIVQICQAGSTSGTPPVPSDSSVTTNITSSVAYTRMSNGVRAVPFVNGIRPGHGGNRIVFGRNQYNSEPSGGKNRLFSGPNPQPSPITSKSIVYRTTFWKTIGSDHHEPTSRNPSMPLVASANSQPPRMYSRILTT